MKVSYFCLAFISSLMACSAFSGEKVSSSISPGIYVVSERGNWGTLSIKNDASGQLRFEISTVGVNIHTCDMTGVIRGAVGYVDDDPECKISFKQTRNKLEVHAITNVCSMYCGARAYFSGIYKTLPKACSENNIKTQHDYFLKLYHARRYEKAHEKISNLIKKCGEFMYWVELDKAKNDLALAQYHSGNPAACLKTLGSTMAGNVSNKEKFYLPPSDHESYIKTAEQIWHNSQLCENKVSKKK